MSERTMMSGKPVFTVPAKSVINFDSRFDKKLLCDGMTFTAGDACVYTCSYCYVKEMARKREAWFEKHGVTGDHMSHVIRRANVIEILRTQIMSKPEEFRRRKQVIYSSPLVDVAANMELVRETVEICKVILELTNWDIRLLSKSCFLPQVAQKLGEWWHLEDRDKPIKNPSGRIIYGVSTGTLDDNLAAAIEDGTALVSKRIKSLHWLQDNGFRTFGMICPSLPQADYGKFALEMAEAIRAEKCEHVWAEVINVRDDSFTRTEAILAGAGYSDEAHALAEVSGDKDKWELYARRTFQGHLEIKRNQGKLRFLQYVNKSNREWWEHYAKRGAVLLASGH